MRFNASNALIPKHVSVTRRKSMQFRLTSPDDTPMSCQSSPAIPVNLRCISTVGLLSVGGNSICAVGHAIRAGLGRSQKRGV
jgi:hypothetical protein